MINPQHLAIGMSLTMRDNFTAQAIRASAAMNNLTGNAKRAAQHQATLARNTNAVGAAIGVGLIGGMVGAYKEAANFNYTMKYVSTIADGTGKSYDKLKAKAIEVGKASTFSPDEVADGMRWMAQSGMKATSIMNSITSASALAQATMTDLGGRGGAADWITNIGMGWNIALDKGENVTRLANVLAKATLKSNTTLHEFGEGMKYTMATAHRMNMTLEETSASIMVLANMGIQASMAGTAMENMLRYATRAAGSADGKKQANALNKLGLDQQSLKDAEGGLIPIGEIMDKIYGGIAKLGNVDAQNAIVDIFGVRGARATAIGNHIKTYREYLKELTNNDDFVQKTAKSMMDTDKGAMMILEDTWKSFKISFGTAIAPVLTPIVKMLAQFAGLLESITSTPVGKWLSVMAFGFITLRTAQMGYRAILLSINLLTGQLGRTSAMTASSTVTGYGRMTAAATMYQRTLQSIAMSTGMASRGAVGSIGRYSHGGYYQIGPGGGYMPLVSGSGKLAMHKMNNFAGKAMLPAGIAGMGLGMMSSQMGGVPALDVASSPLSGAAMGAMVGSIVPGIGTAIGGIVGGSIGLLTSLHTAVTNEGNKLKSTFDKIQRTADGEFADPDKVKQEFDMLQKMNWKQRAYLEATSAKNSFIAKGNSGNPYERDWQELNNNIEIYMDGSLMMKKSIIGNNVKENINLGIN